MQVVEPTIPSTPTVLRAVCSLKALLQNWHGNSHSFWSFGTPDTQIFPTQTNLRISCQEGNEGREGREVKPTTSWNDNLMSLSLSLSLSLIYIYVCVCALHPKIAYLITPLCPKESHGVHGFPPQTLKNWQPRRALNCQDCWGAGYMISLTSVWM